MSEQIRIRTIAELVAAIPALLGFHPVDSLVMVFQIPGRGVGPIVRVDLDSAPGGYAQIVTMVRREDCEAMFMVVVSGDEHAPALLTHAEGYAAALAAVGVEVRRFVHTDATSAGARWHDRITGEAGTVADPATSAVTIEAVVRGKRIEADRTAIAARFTPRAAVDVTDAVTAVQADRDGVTRAVLTELVAVVRRLGRADDALAARVGVLLTVGGRDHAERDAMLIVGVIDSGAASAVFADIAARLRNNARVEALTLAALFAYAASDTVAAGIAVQVAQAVAAGLSTPAPVLLGLIDAAVRGGARPQMMVELLATGRDAAARFGIDPDTD